VPQHLRQVPFPLLQFCERLYLEVDDVAITSRLMLVALDDKARLDDSPESRSSISAASNNVSETLKILLSDVCHRCVRRVLDWVARIQNISCYIRETSLVS
jgi:hypothetical protein